MKSKAKRPEAKTAGRKNKVLVNFILDKSGSMSSVQSETIKGFNTYIAELKTAKDVEYRFSLTMFDTAFKIVHAAVPLETVSDLTTKSYSPDGMTALYDAIGSTVRRVETDAEKVDKVITVIYTDGHENSSHEHSYQNINDLIKAKEALGNWTFVFLGATMDAIDIGVGLGVRAGNAYKYAPKHTNRVYAAAAMSTNSFSRGSAMQSSCFVDKSLQGDAITGVGGLGDPNSGGLSGNGGLGGPSGIPSTTGSSFADMIAEAQKNTTGSWKNKIHK